MWIHHQTDEVDRENKCRWSFLACERMTFAELLNAPVPCHPQQTITLSITSLSQITFPHPKTHSEDKRTSSCTRRCAQTLDAAPDYQSCRSSRVWGADAWRFDLSRYFFFHHVPPGSRSMAALSHSGDCRVDIDHLLFNLSPMQRIDGEGVWDKTPRKVWYLIQLQ